MIIIDINYSYLHRQKASVHGLTYLYTQPTFGSVKSYETNTEASELYPMGVLMSRQHGCVTSHKCITVATGL